MRRTPVDLYRMGNAVSARLNNVRAKDIDLYENEGQTWVAANSGGISTFSDRGNSKNWWKLDQGAEIPNQLRVINDYGNHWLWEPSYSMPMDDYQEALRSIGEQFYKVS
ncbi:hypothetical protein GS601_21105 [Myxacorys almedinensis A]|uniref:Tse2 ADP-ribosyltransferase toxin domain-containing protein n=2 Tax=Myxacorys TaxID=2056239 RepID=A0A8J7ZCZ2_9CYAN|nr:hypothetical protein [Myxacorys almedinensis A]